jgi:hypothetical protein
MSIAFASQHPSDPIPWATFIDPRVLDFLDLSIDEFNGETSCNEHSGSSQSMAASSSSSHSDGVSL